MTKLTLEAENAAIARLTYWRAIEHAQRVAHGSQLTGETRQLLIAYTMRRWAKLRGKDDVTHD